MNERSQPMPNRMDARGSFRLFLVLVTAGAEVEVVVGRARWAPKRRPGPGSSTFSTSPPKNGGRWRTLHRSPSRMTPDGLLFTNPDLEEGAGLRPLLGVGQAGDGGAEVVLQPLRVTALEAPT